YTRPIQIQLIYTMGPTRPLILGLRGKEVPDSQFVNSRTGRSSPPLLTRYRFVQSSGNRLSVDMCCFLLQYADRSGLPIRVTL
ncbi:hypothetical protein DFQ28_002409, partial [Apophysomyces sp. BC1034]